ncbi:DUF1236 domain-containing protein [Mesorhizobium sp.]|uniref:DUF1236 domain-containing protein n=1 Tax=Mesorhizobium sp. TaxID=1871066 RepID=UPI00257F8CE0|nr:DUF1236 domain-containing protein [Mesorhizobium sp.]
MISLSSLPTESPIRFCAKPSEQETVIREYVKKQPLASVKVPGIELNIGSTLPETVELHEVPDTKYRYVVVDNRTVVVDPGTRKIIKVIE